LTTQRQLLGTQTTNTEYSEEWIH